MKVEICRVKLVGLGKVGHTHAKVAELVHRSWSLLETLELVDPAVFLGGLCRRKVNLLLIH